MSESTEYNDWSGSEIAVVGMAGRFPGARNVQEFWENLKNGVESISFFTDEELLSLGVEPELINNPNYVKSRGGILENDDVFDGKFFGYAPTEAEIMEPQMRIFHECAWEVLEDAGYVPGEYDGSIGLYAGAGSSSYWEAYTILTGKRDALGRFASSLLNQKDFLSTRIAYRLNLKGPAISVHTACSTSLVAIHLACQALLNGECDMSLAGGITVTPEKEKGYLFQEGMIRSPDGHCRAFDADSKGTAIGNGVGLVLLKPLEEAVADGDYIYAVIKGTAVNNDGIRKIGYTAPSIEGQVEVIQTAIQMAEVEPESISYVETHGTGTILGDPMEIESLKLAFNSNEKGFCAIGSVKTNVGHLDAAAGVAGFIKTVLALKHKWIPPSLHFKKPNPKIDFENSPFYVNSESREWKNTGTPLRAGVSSFGIGGTNAHVILEEWPMEKTAGAKHHSKQREHKLILLSAKTASALEKKTEDMVAFLKENPLIKLADAAYTLQSGRSAFPHRRMAVCPDADSAVEALSSLKGGVRTFCTDDKEKSLVFMFSGLGAQYENMGLGLYQTEPVFREKMDRCFGILDTLVDYKIKDILYPAAASPERIDNFEVAQLAVFILEYALAKLLMKWGVKPKAMIGYSFGEYSAACLAGVLSLEDALKLIVARGKLIAGVPGGSMLSVPLPVEELRPIMDGRLSIAIDNGPSTIVSGPTEFIDAFEKQLKEKRLLCMKVPNSHALHSRMMEPILKKFEEQVTRVKLNKPQIPYISNVSGNWMTAEEAVDPAYWSGHLAGTVQFADGIETLKRESQPVFVEIGPGRDLKTLLVRHKDMEKDSEIQALNVIRPQRQNVHDERYLLTQIGQLWLYGIKIDWSAFYENQERYRIPLPPYPFEGEKIMAEGDPARLFAGKIPGGAPIEEKTELADWFYIPSWKRSRWPGAVTWEEATPSKWLVFIDDDGLGAMLTERLEKKGKNVVRVKKGDRFVKAGNREYTLDPSREEHYKSLFKELDKEDNLPGLIIHMWAVGGNPGNWAGIEHVDTAQELSFYSLLHIARAFGRQNSTKQTRIMVVTDHMQEVFGEERIDPLKSLVLGPVKGIPGEYDNIQLRSIDVNYPAVGEPRKEKLIPLLLNEFMTETGERIVAIRENCRWVEAYESVPFEKPTGQSSHLREGGVYLVTGGLGGVGLTLAEYLAAHVSPRLLLAGRSDFPAREEWEQWLADRGEEDDVSRKIRQVKKLEDLGASVSIFCADIANLEQVQDLVEQAQVQFGRINGVIHAAGLPDGTLIELRTREISESILSPKVRGTIVLDTVFKDVELDFFILCSALDAIMTAPGQVGYCAANNFLDAFARYRAHRGDTFPLSINWDRWEGLGIAVIIEALNKEVTGSELNGGMTPGEGMEVFGRLLADAPPQVLVSVYDLNKKIESHREFKVSSIIGSLEGKSDSTNLSQRPDLDTAYIAPRDETEKTLSQTWSRTFGFEQVGIRDDFFELGGDSLKALTVIASLHKELDIEVPVQEFFNYPTIRELAGYINRDAAKSSHVSIQAAENKDYYELSSSQKRLYVLQQMDLESTTYHVTMMVRLEGNIDHPRLEIVFQKLIHRHDALRTSFTVVHGQGKQQILEKVEFKPEYLEIDKNSQSADNLAKSFIRPFELTRAPLMRVGLIKEEARKHLLIIDMHHIISDGLSLNILLDELIALYEGAELPQLKISYKDFSEWQNKMQQSKEMEKQEHFWLDKYKGNIPRLSMPLDFSRPHVKNFEGDWVHFEIAGELSSKIEQLNKETGTTLYMLLLAVYNVLLHKYCGQTDIIVGSPVSGRRHADLQNLVGVFVNMIAHRNHPTPEKTFARFLEELKVNALEGYENQDFQFEELVNKLGFQGETGRNPLFDVGFVMQAPEGGIDNIDGNALKEDAKTDDLLKVTSCAPPKKVARFDILLEAYALGDKIVINLEYSTQLFKKSSVEMIGKHLREILEQVVDNKELTLKDITLSSDLHVAKTGQIDLDFDF